MRWLFWLLALFAAAVAVALGGRLNDGYVLFVLAPWRVEVSLNLFCFALLALLFVAYGLLRGIFAAIDLPRRAQEFRRQRSRDKAFTALQESLRLLFEGRYGQALKRAVEVHAVGVMPGLAALLAAWASQRLRDRDRQSHWAERAITDDPRCEAAALMLEAGTCNEMRDYEGALQALARLQQKFGRHLAALRLELRARQGVGDWAAVIRVARQLEKRSAMSAEAAHEIKVSAHLAGVAARSGDEAALLAHLRAVPDNERDARLVLAVARELATLGAADKAAEAIEAQLDDGREPGWSRSLVAFYGQLDCRDLTARIARGERWLPGHPRDAILLLTLGRLCRRQRLWGKAQSYLEASLAVDRTLEAHLELARLFDQLGRGDDANRHYRLGVELLA